MGGEGMRGAKAHRAHCPGCGRSTAVTWNARTGQAYLRSHNRAIGKPCDWSRRTVDRSLVDH